MAGTMCIAAGLRETAAPRSVVDFQTQQRITADCAAHKVAARTDLHLGNAMEQRLTFDQAASIYRTARPGYPDALVDDVISFADLKPNDSILEVGCGTGQATRSFASRGFPILAIDPGPEMLRAARESLAGSRHVEFSETTFEAWPSEREGFRLIVAAQSWHWVPREIGFAKAAEVLSPGGWLAIFGHVPVGLPAPLLARFREIYLRQTGAWGPPPEAGYLPTGPFKIWFDESALFGPVEHKSYAWKWRHTASSYADFLRTRSDHRMMNPMKREDVIGEIAEAIREHGGEFEVDYESHLYIAERL
jgi:SAM-dependent methyltransferase